MGLVAYLSFFLIMVSIFSIATLGLNVQWGLGGLFNAGVVGFYAIGAYGFAILSGPPRGEQLGGFALPWILGVIGAMLISGMVAIIIGLATINLRDDYLAIATFGIAISIQLIALNWENLTGGPNGLASLPRPFADADGSGSRNSFGFLGMILLITFVCYTLVERIARSPWGRVLRAIREDEQAAIALGKNASRIRLEAFTVGAIFIALGGALQASFTEFVSPFDFLPIVTFQLWTMLIVGGSGNNKGAIVGAVVVWAVWTGSGVLILKVIPPSYQTQGAAIQGLLIGVVLICSLLFRPQGLLGEPITVSRHL